MRRTHRGHLREGTAKDDPLPGEAVDEGGRVSRITVAAQMVSTERVDRDEYDPGRWALVSPDEHRPDPRDTSPER